MLGPATPSRNCAAINCGRMCLLPLGKSGLIQEEREFSVYMRQGRPNMIYLNRDVYGDFNKPLPMNYLSGFLWYDTRKPTDIHFSMVII